MAVLKIPYIIRREKVSHRSGRHIYFYWHPPKRYLERSGMSPQPLGHTAPGNVPEKRLFEKACREAIRLNAELKRRLADGTAMSVSEPHGSLPWLIAEWQQSPEYAAKSATTKQNGYTYACRILVKWSATNGHPLVSSLTREAFWKFRDSLYKADPKTGQVRIRRAQLVLAVLRILLEKAYNSGLVTANVATRPKAIKPKSRLEIWQDAEIDRFVEMAISMGRPLMAVAVRLGADVALRRGDVVAAKWHQYDGTSIAVRQSKTSKWIDVPVLDELQRLLAMVPRRADDDAIVSDERTDRRFKPDEFSREFRMIMNAAELPETLQFRDLRRTAVVHMGRAGLPPQLITAVTGHDIDECMRILETYLPRDSEMAKAAIDRMREYRLNLKSQKEIDISAQLRV